MDSHEILLAVYQIQGLADPAHGHSEDSLRQRMEEIYELACRVMLKTGFNVE